MGHVSKRRPEADAFRRKSDRDTNSDFAAEFPDAEVVGTDLSPIQPSFVPPNLKLQVPVADKIYPPHS